MTDKVATRCPKCGVRLLAVYFTRYVNARSRSMVLLTYVHAGPDRGPCERRVPQEMTED
jgi:hypothetical protein